MKINEYLNKLFSAIGYKSLKGLFSFGDKEIEVQLFNNGRSGYLTIEVDQNHPEFFSQFIEERQADLFEWVQTEYKEFKGNVTKNIYLLFVVSKVFVKQVQIKNVINIEEDPYFFKKYVLSYSEKSFKEFVSLYTEKEDFLDFTLALASDQKRFKRFTDSSYYDDTSDAFLYNLLVKLPILRLETSSKNIGDIEKILKAELDKKKLTKIESSIFAKFEAVEIENLKIKEIDDWINEK